MVAFEAYCEVIVVSHEESSYMYCKSCFPVYLLQVHQLLEMLKREQDAESNFSGEGSNTDSGRGPSEEGESSMRPSVDGVGPAQTTGKKTSQVYSRHGCCAEQNWAGNSTDDFSLKMLTEFAKK
jgi:hypothetical protein